MTRVLAASRIATLLGSFDRDPAYKGLAEGLRVLITDGRVPVGARLPSERELTDAVAVSRTTVTRAYAELRGHYAFVAMHAEHPTTLVAARQECPLIVGVGEGAAGGGPREEPARSPCSQSSGTPLFPSSTSINSA